MKQKSLIDPKNLKKLLLSFLIFAIIFILVSNQLISQAANSTLPDITGLVSPLPNTEKNYFSDFVSPIVIENKVLGETTEATSSAPTKTFGQFIKPKKVVDLVIVPEKNNIQSQETFKKSYTIALLGDSMIDTLAPQFYHLQNALKRFYPKTDFQILNYGAGAEDLEKGLHRLTSQTTYLGQNRPPLVSLAPDIIVIESFAYNHWANSQADLDRQWLTLAKIVESIKTNLPQTKIIIASTIAPDIKNFAKGAAGYDSITSYTNAQTVKAYLENALNFAKSQNLPFADAYHPSLDPAGSGLLKYINQADNIHPSGEGGRLFSQKIAEAIAKYHLL